MASSSTSAADEHRNASEEIASSPSTSSSLLSSCFNCCCFNLCSNQSHSSPHKSPSTPLVTNDFQETASSPPTNAFQELVPSSSPSSSSAAAYSISMQRKKVPYDVFINHRGPDVKHTLAATLYHTLSDMGLRVFLDKKELQLGDYLPKELQEAMQSASLHIAIFSKTYAESPWCLAELAYMLKTGTPIIPIFYHLQPSKIRHDNGLYAEALSRHKEKGRYSSGKVEEWKDAISRVSYNIGEIINNDNDCDRVLKNVVNRVLPVIKNVPFLVAKHPVGLDEALLDFERTTLEPAKIHHNVQILGIWGMGGSGKTTLAKQLYNNKCRDMEKSSFLIDIRDADSKSVLHKKQQKLVEDLRIPNISIENIEEGKGILASRLKSVRVLIVLDDVDNIDQMDALVPDKDSLGEGSLVVVTTRKLDVLQGWDISSIYKMKALDQDHAQQLFCWHSFLRPLPCSGFEDLVEKFIRVCDGLPLSLKVFGGLLYGKSSKEYWESQLQKINRILPDDIITRLKVSYDALDYEEKAAFLDVACFFIGEQKTSVIAAWDGLTGAGLCIWEGLFNKCLIEVYGRDHIRMHDHLRDLGRKIANDQSPYRLWSPHQIINVYNEVQGVSIRAIMIETADSTSEVGQIPRCSAGGELIVNTNRGLRPLAPSSVGLKFLRVRENDYNQVIGDLSRDLIWLQWFNIKQRNLASLKSLKNLRVLQLGDEKCTWKSGLEELWESENNAPVQLKDLLIYSCNTFQRFPESIGCLRHLKKIVAYQTGVESLPDEFCRLESLEHLDLSECGKLALLPDNFGDLRNLRHLDLSSCKELRKLPVSFKELSLLQHLNLGWCSGLSIESGMLETMAQLEYLNLSRCSKMEGLPHNITNQAYLRELYLSECGKLALLPDNFGDLRNLRHLDLSGCSKLRKLPVSFKELSLLQHLDLGWCSGLSIESEMLETMAQLEYLNLSGCSEMEGLPRNITNQAYLRELYLSLCGKLALLPDNFGDLRNLRHLGLSGCSKLRKLPVSFKELSLLQHLDLGWCSGLSIESEMLETMAQLEYLSLSGCRQMEGLLRNITNLANLRTLHLRDVREIPVNIGQLRKLQEIIIGSNLLEGLPTSIGDLSSLTSLGIYGCPKLECLPESLGRLNHLEMLSIHNSGVRSLSIVASNASTSEDCYPGLQFLYLEGNDCLTEIDVQSTTLKTMHLLDCKMLRKTRGIDGLVNMQTLMISGCPELEFLPSFAQLACLQEFELGGGCYGVKRIDGLEQCRALEKVRVHTRWEEAGIQSLHRMERLREVTLKANSRAGVECCIQSIRNLQRRPERIGICTRAVPDAASLLDCFDFSDLSVVGSIANQKLLGSERLLLGESPKPSYTARCILVCLVVNCESPEASLSMTRGDSIFRFADVELEEGKWVITTVITQPSIIFISNNDEPLQIGLNLGKEVEKGEVEKGLLVTGEEERVMEAFVHLCSLLSD